jgi:hypothetical protein
MDRVIEICHTKDSSFTRRCTMRFAMRSFLVFLSLWLALAPLSLASNKKTDQPSEKVKACNVVAINLPCGSENVSGPYSITLSCERDKEIKLSLGDLGGIDQQRLKKSCNAKKVKVAVRKYSLWTEYALAVKF